MRNLAASRKSYPVVTVFALLLLPLAACSGGAGAAPSGAVTAEIVTTGHLPAQVVTTQAQVDVTPTHPRGRPGPDFLVFAALHESIDLTPEQTRAIRALVPAEGSEGRAFDATRATALAQAIRSGVVDVPATAAVDDDTTARRAAAASALTTLHATLTATQRRALVDAVERTDAQRGGEAGPHGGPMGQGEHGPMGHLLEGLNLTAAQEQAIASKLEATRPPPPSDAERAAFVAQHDSVHAAMRAKLETFAGEGFDATAFVDPPAGAAPPRAHADHFVADLAVVTTVLDAAQRETLAQRIEAGPSESCAEHAPPK